MHHLLGGGLAGYMNDLHIILIKLF